jgi:hypothetical protein
LPSQENVPIEDQRHPEPITPLPAPTSTPDVKREESKKDGGSYSQRAKSEQQQKEKPGKVKELPPPSLAPPTSQEPERPAREKPSQQSEVKPERPAIVLSERAQIFWDNWRMGPWFKGIPPKLTEKRAERCETVAGWKTIPTVDEILKTRHWYKKKYPEHQGFDVGNFVNAYPDYLSAQYQEVQANRYELVGATTSGYNPRNRVLTREELKNKPIW